jgi:hypothetical protein
LSASSGQTFEGCKPIGAGFILSKQEARALIENDPRNKEVLFPYLNGDDLNSRWDCSASRWAIDFRDWPIERAKQYPECFSIVEKTVKPFRAQSNRKVYRERWWQYAETRPALRRAIAKLDRVLVIARHSKTGLPQFVTTGQVLSDATVTFATSQAARLALLSSSVHFEWWTTKGESTLETRLRYTPSDGFETFPQPRLTGRIDRAGQELDEFRNETKARRKIGLTDLYNLVYDQAIHDADIVRLREIHVEIDEAVREAYALDEEREPAIREYEKEKASEPLPSWRELEFGHGFHETRQGLRFTISPQASVDVLDKLLALNHFRYQQEVEQGLHSGKGRGASRKKGSGHATSEAASILDDGALFPPEGALF